MHSQHNNITDVQELKINVSLDHIGDSFSTCQPEFEDIVAAVRVTQRQEESTKCQPRSLVRIVQRSYASVSSAHM